VRAFVVYDSIRGMVYVPLVNEDAVLRVRVACDDTVDSASVQHVALQGTVGQSSSTLFK
jgi:hypothetical protein